MMHVHQRVVEGHVGARADLDELRSAWSASLVPARVDDDELRARALTACLMNVAATGWFAVVFEPVTRATSAFATSA